MTDDPPDVFDPWTHFEGYPIIDDVMIQPYHEASSMAMVHSDHAPWQYKEK